MSDRSKFLTEGVRKFSPLLQAFEAGYTLEQVRESVEEALLPEFQNPEVLKRYGVDLLTVEATNVAKVKLNPAAFELYAHCVDLRRRALASNADQCARVCAAWEQEIGAGLHLYWNTARFEVNKEELPLDEFAFEVFRTMGSLLEGTLLPYLRELLHMHRSLEGRGSEKREIAAMDFGAIVSSLESGVVPRHLLRPQPTKIPLNQWRNIAQHFSMAADGSSISCKYGRRLQHEIRLPREELFAALVSVVVIFQAIRTAHTLFFLDNSDVLSAHCKGYARKDTDLQFQFIVGAASQGFEVKGLRVSESLAEAMFVDVTAGEPMKRGIHASQFVVELWKATRSALVQITYAPKGGQPTLRARASASICEEVASGKKSVADLAAVIEFWRPENEV